MVIFNNMFGKLDLGLILCNLIYKNMFFTSSFEISICSANIKFLIVEF